MSSIRKLAQYGVKNLSRSGFKAPVMTRCMSSVIERKEQAEEARYIRDIEARKSAEIRANLERIMALDDSNQEKAAIVDLLGNLVFLFYNFFKSTCGLIFQRRRLNRALLASSVWTTGKWRSLLVFWCLHL